MTKLEEYVARGPALLRTAYMLCGDRYLAEDLVQEVLAGSAAWRRQRIEHLEAYYEAAVVRQFLTLVAPSHRQRAAARLRPGAAGLPVGPTPPTSTPSGTRIWTELAGLPRRRRILVLSLLRGPAGRQIAALIGCTQRRLRRAPPARWPPCAATAASTPPSSTLARDERTTR